MPRVNQIREVAGNSSATADSLSSGTGITVGEQVFFNKSGRLVTVTGFEGDNLIVQKPDGKQMIVPATGVARLGPWGCLCQTFHHRTAGSGCCLCSSE